MGKQKIAGTCYFKIDGEQLALEGGLEVPLSSNERESIQTSAGVYYSEKDLVPTLKGTFVVPKGFPIDKVNDADNMVITAELANGMTYVLRDAYRVNAATYKADDGKTELEFHGAKGEYL